jgi:hypothetical protein
MNYYYAAMKLFGGNPENHMQDGFPPGYSQEFSNAFFELEQRFEGAKAAAQTAAAAQQEEEMRQAREETDQAEHPFSWVGLSPPPLLPQYTRNMPEEIRRTAVAFMRAYDIDRRANEANRAAASEKVRKDYMCPFIGKNGECASLVKYLADLAETSTWTNGERVQGSTTIRPGTPIATFNYFPGNKYGELTYGPPEARGGAKYKSHAAIYLGQDEDGIWVFDQGQPNSPRVHRIDFIRDDGNAFESGKRFFVVVAPPTEPRRARIYTWLP